MRFASGGAGDAFCAVRRAPVTGDGLFFGAPWSAAVGREGIHKRSAKRAHEGTLGWEGSAAGGTRVSGALPDA